MIDRARLRLRALYADAGKAHDFEVFSPYLAPEQREPSTGQLARELATTEEAARVALHRFRRRFGSALREEVASTLEDAAQVESELRFLLAALAGHGHSVRRCSASSQRYGDKDKCPLLVIPSRAFEGKNLANCGILLGRAVASNPVTPWRERHEP